MAKLLDDRIDLGISKPVTVRDLDWVWHDPRELRRRVLAIRADTRISEDQKSAMLAVYLPTARLDDAMNFVPARLTFCLVVAIADVSHYVAHGDALDREAFARGNSVYFPRRVIPMLPEKLSNGLCSLNPNVERLAMACEMAITPQGEVARYEFYPAVFRSRARLTYTEVWSRLQSGKAPEHLLLFSRSSASSTKARHCSRARNRPTRTLPPRSRRSRRSPPW